MSKVEIRGVIVSSDFDNEYFQGEMEKGIITPESMVRRDLEQAKLTEPLELYINSVGGSVFAAHEMINALIDWKNATKQQIKVVVGSICASAGSTIAVALGPVTCHENSEFMFHSAQSQAYGGPEHMGDTMALLDQINAGVVKSLVSKYKADMADVQEWFSEGRMGWLTAEDAQKIGLVTNVVGQPAPLLTFDDVDFEAMDDQVGGMEIAAMIEVSALTENTTEDIEQMAKLPKAIASLLGIDTEEPAVEDIEQKLNEMEAVAQANADAAYEEGMAAGKLEGAKAAAELAQADIEAAQAKVAELENISAELTEKLENAETAKASAEERLQALAPGLKGGDTGDDDQGVSGSFMDAVDELVADGHSIDAAMIKVQRQYPDLHAQYIEQANK